MRRKVTDREYCPAHATPGQYAAAWVLHLDCGHTLTVSAADGARFAGAGEQQHALCPECRDAGRLRRRVLTERSVAHIIETD